MFTNSPQSTGMMLSKPSSIKKGCYICRWLDKVDMHMYAIFDENIPCGSRVMSIFAVVVRFPYNVYEPGMHVIHFE